MTIEMPDLCKRYVDDGNRLFLMKVAGVLHEKNAQKCRSVYSPLNFLFRNCHLFCTCKRKMMYKQRYIKTLPARKYSTVDSSAGSHWINKIFTEKTSVLFRILSGHNSPPLPCSQNRFHSLLTNRPAKSGEFLSLQKST